MRNLDLKALNDDELLQQTQEKTHQERLLTAEVLRMLQEIERRKLFAARGFSSLFQFCVEFLGYSESAAHRRIASMRLLAQIPTVEEKIKEGSLTLSNIAQAEAFFKAEAKVNHKLTLEEKQVVLEKLEGKSSREAEKELLSLSSCPEALTQKEKVRPVSETHYEVKFYADQELMNQLEQLRGLLAHRDPNMTTAELIAELAKIAMAKLRPKKPDTKLDSLPTPEVKASKPKEETPRSRYLPAQVKSRVYHRDGGRCTFIDPKTGRKCGSTFGLEYDHVRIPFAKGGANIPENLALRCRNHNLLNGILEFGLPKMQQYKKQ
jgi:hypothetical protein